MQHRHHVIKKMEPIRATSAVGATKVLVSNYYLGIINISSQNMSTKVLVSIMSTLFPHVDINCCCASYVIWSWLDFFVCFKVMFDKLFNNRVINTVIDATII